MIIINLKGGTGNQLFQYALGRHLALKNNDALKLDIDGLARANAVGDIYRPFCLSSLNTNKEIATAEEIKRLKYPYGLISKAWRWFNFKILKRHNIYFDAKVLNWKGDIYLDGYWQSPKYFEAIRELLLTELSLTVPLSPEADYFSQLISKNRAVSLHVRRGDYIKNPRVAAEFGPCSISYYKNAMAEVEKNIPSPTYFVFSDDIEWVKQNLPLDDKEIFVKGENITDIEELILMSKCQHNIIANSSFSWWGAWLNQNQNKIVIAPTPWFDKLPYDQELIPPSWIQLPK